MTITLDELFNQSHFTPNPAQKEAITHTGSPLFLVAGPGSGKTRVLLWRTVNLIVCQGVKPEEIMLATFTEKAAQQLKEGLLSLLGMVTNLTGQPYDISQMYLGTVHSLCNRMLTDRNFTDHRSRRDAAPIMDQLEQYFFLGSPKFWRAAVKELQWEGEIESLRDTINTIFAHSQYPQTSKHLTVLNLQGFFNRLSEENLTPEPLLQGIKDATLNLQGLQDCDSHQMEMLLTLYRVYLQEIGNKVDLSLLQQKAYQIACEHPNGGTLFKHVIVDEYQDTNAIQELLYFKLASGHRNLTVVGDDEQALYRFRGATVENFVQFPERSLQHLGVSPTRIALSTNYRSRSEIVKFYTRFMDTLNWSRPQGGAYRIEGKGITAHSTDTGKAVVVSTGSTETVYDEIAGLVRNLLDQKKVSDPNQIAFLFPILKNAAPVARMRTALEKVGLQVYAPRAARFLEGTEPTAVIGLLLKIFGRPPRNLDFDGGQYRDYHDWLDDCERTARQLMQDDPAMSQFVQDRKGEIKETLEDHAALHKVLEQQGWSESIPYDPAIHKRPLLNANNINTRAKKVISQMHLDRIAKERLSEGNPFTLRQIINRSTALDWNILDMFYRFCGFDHFKEMFDLAENGTDEGPISNLSLVSQLLSKFIDQTQSVLTAHFMKENRMQNLFFGSYLFALFRLAEGEYEDAEDPFPKGRIPFLTIHQAKGLEFPVVVLGSPRKTDRGPQRVEQLVRPFLTGDPEPLNRVSELDIMRMFYVALSRAESLMVVANPVGRGQQCHPIIKENLDRCIKVSDFNLSFFPENTHQKGDAMRNYSYTGDYLGYLNCPRYYMTFSKYGFAPSRTTAMFFGQLVHQTVEDLHNRLIAVRSQEVQA